MSGYLIMLNCRRQYFLLILLLNSRKSHLFYIIVVRHRQFMSSFCPAASQHLTAIFAAHAATETMFVGSLSFGWLERSFHFLLSLKGGINPAGIHFIKSGTKVRQFCELAKKKAFRNFFGMLFGGLSIHRNQKLCIAAGIAEMLE